MNNLTQLQVYEIVHFIFGVLCFMIFIFFPNIWLLIFGFINIIFYYVYYYMNKKSLNTLMRLELAKVEWEKAKHKEIIKLLERITK